MILKNQNPSLLKISNNHTTLVKIPITFELLLIIIFLKKIKLVFLSSNLAFLELIISFTYKGEDNNVGASSP
jgi:hypothetical protein